MSNNLATFEEKVKNKLMDSIAGLLPEDDVDQLVKQQHEHFIKNHLPELIQAELKAVYKQMVIGHLTSASSYSYMNGQVQQSEIIKKVLTEAAPEIFTNMMGGMMQMAIERFRNELTNSQY